MDQTDAGLQRSSVRDTYLGIHVERTAGTPDKKLAGRILKGIKVAIERGEYVPAAEPIEAAHVATFAPMPRWPICTPAAKGAFLSKIIEHTGTHAIRDKALADISQIAIDNLARPLFPSAAPSTLNRQVYTPISAVPIFVES